MDSASGTSGTSRVAAAEVDALARAVELARRGLATTRPNPAVGAVILDAAGAVAGEGWHERPGGPHAEVRALAAAGGRALGGTAVVTLEPCDHTGRTGPCTAALLAAGVRRVVYAVADPDPVAAGGAATLAAAGVEVVDGEAVTATARATGRPDPVAAAHDVVSRWLAAAERGRPVTTWKYAATLDGRSAAADGSSRWITGPAARADVHLLRAGVDAVVAGVGTVLADDPALTARSPDGTPAADQPLRVVVDTHGRTPAAAQVRDGSAPTWVATAAEVGHGPDGRVDLVALGVALRSRGVQVALLEGGPALAGAFLRAGLIDRVVAYLAPALLGTGAAALGDAGISGIDAALRLRVEDLTRVGDDIRVTAVPVRDPRDRAAHDQTEEL